MNKKSGLFLLLFSSLSGCWNGETCTPEHWYASNISINDLTTTKSDDIEELPLRTSFSLESEDVQDLNLEIEEIRKLGVRYDYPEFFIEDLPVQVGATKTYSDIELSIPLLKRTLTVTNQLTHEPTDIITFGYGDASYTHDEKVSPFLGWAPANDSAFLYDTYQGTVLQRFGDGMPETGEPISLPLGGTYFWVDGPLHLARASGPSESEVGESIVEFFGVDGNTRSSRVYYEYTYSGDSSTYSFYLQDEAPVLLGTRQVHGSYSTYRLKLSRDGSQILIEGYPEDVPHLVIDVNARTLTESKDDSSFFEPPVIELLEHSFDGAFSSTLSNDEQIWNTELVLTLKENDRSSSEGNSDKFVYSYELRLERGGSFATESGEFIVAHAPDACYTD